MNDLHSICLDLLRKCNRNEQGLITDEFLIQACMKMTVDKEKYWENFLKDLFTKTLDGIKECDPLSLEWDFFWNTLNCLKTCFEAKKREKNENN